MNKKGIISYWNTLIDTIADKETVMKFFFVFSRFEYALKRAKYLKPNKENIAWADWDKFSKDLENIFTTNKTPELREAIDYLQKHPPLKQIVKKGKIGWQKKKPLNHKPDIHWILKQVRIVRNNLFHGGKFPDGPIQDPARNPELIKNCLIILEACLELHPEVQKYFKENYI